MPGILTFLGADLKISGIRINLDGSAPPPVEATLRTDMWPQWLAIAVGHAEAAHQANSPLRAPDARLLDDAAKSDALLNELRYGLQAMSAAAIAVDAFYAAIKSRSSKPPPPAPRGSVNRTPRYAQIAETLKRELHIRKNFESVRENLKTLFRFRDWAVHPGSKFVQPVYRQEIDSAVDWHSVAFSAENSLKAVALAVKLISSLIEIADRGNSEIVEWKTGAKQGIEDVRESMTGECWKDTWLALDQ